MLEFLKNNIFAIIFGITSLVTSIIAIHYARKMYALERRGFVGGTSRTIVVFWSREEMIDSLLEQYRHANKGDDIWAHTVGLQNFPGSVHDRVMEAAARGVQFRYLVTLGHPALSEFVALFSTIRSAQIAGLPDNKIRVQGLSDREVVIAFPTLTTYTAIKFTDPEFVKIVRAWFDSRWKTAMRTNPILKGSTNH
ncbi:hypothetical protein [Amycolatopsis sp. NPDC051128]|uniref:hypothetical protein n=1 Tax=Amycolatopsis sp. NPDC051128 TaxID=3155412 RepID=UPI0034284B3F